MFYLIWEDGHLLRFDSRDEGNILLAEEIDLTEGPEKLTAATMLLGRATLICGDSAGRLHGWFAVRPEQASTADGYALVRAKTLPNLTGAFPNSASAPAAGRTTTASAPPRPSGSLGGRRRKSAGGDAGWQ